MDEIEVIEGIEALDAADKGGVFLKGFFRRQYLNAGVQGREFELIIHLLSFKWGDYGQIRPSVSTLAKLMHYNERSTRRLIASLEKKGLLIIKRRQLPTKNFLPSLYSFEPLMSICLKLDLEESKLNNKKPCEILSIPPDESVSTPPDKKDSTPLTNLSGKYKEDKKKKINNNYIIHENNFEQKFNEFYSLQMKKQNPVGAKKKYFELLKTHGEELHEKIITAYKAQLAAYPGRAKQWWRLPTTWLNQAGWEDEIIDENEVSKNGNSGNRQKSKSEIGRENLRKIQDHFGTSGAF